MEKRGRFITMEGIEGSGKTTQHQMLTSYLAQNGIDCLATKQPGGTPIGREIRKILLHKDSVGMTPGCEALLYLADRAQHHHEVIEPALAKGTWILSDRYQDSTMAYQGAARGLPQSELDYIFKLVTNNLQPDLTLLLDLDPEAGVGRALARLANDQMSQEEGRFEDEALDFHKAVRASFLEFAAKEPHRYAIINADQKPDEVSSDIQAVLKERGLV